MACATMKIDWMWVKVFVAMAAAVIGYAAFVLWMMGELPWPK
jgi:hypothetical protein